jgi:hypothetical protein
MSDNDPKSQRVSDKARLDAIEAKIDKIEAFDTRIYTAECWIDKIPTRVVGWKPRLDAIDADLDELFGTRS